MAEVRVVFRKYNGDLHWHLTMHLLGEDEYGIWAGLAAGGSVRRGDEPPVPIPHAHVGLFPHNGWWAAWFNDRPSGVEIYCDVSTQPQWVSPEEVTMIDLDLDVVREWNGRVVLLDEDEFAEHQIRYRYPDSVVEGATQAASYLQGMMDQEPFVTVYKRWLAQVQVG